MEKSRIIVELKTISNLLRQMMEHHAPDKEHFAFTSAQIMIIGYLSDHEGVDVYQKDLENEFHVRRSTITGVLQGMEKKGLIERGTVSSDARLKRINLTGEGRKIHQRIVRSMRLLECVAMKDVTKEEKKVFLDVLNKIKENFSNEISEN